MPYIPNGATIQLGIGGLANAIGYRLENHRNIKVFTEMLTESMIELYEKRVVKEKMIACFALGNRRLYEFCNNNDMVELWQLPDLCNPVEIGKRDNFISVNTCLMVDFVGQVASEQIGSRIVSCTGGASDTVRGARMSKGGRSFICVASTYTTKDGEVRSNIVSTLPPYTPVSVQRTDVDAIVTEFGIAELYCRSNEERVAALINIAHPDFREGLKEEARKLNMLR
jgi:acyl-CoA hydrolase